MMSSERNTQNFCCWKEQIGAFFREFYTWKVVRMGKKWIDTCSLLLVSYFSNENITYNVILSGYLAMTEGLTLFISALNTLLMFSSLKVFIEVLGIQFFLFIWYKGISTYFNEKGKTLLNNSKLLKIFIISMLYIHFINVPFHIVNKFLRFYFLLIFKIEFELKFRIFWNIKFQHLVPITILVSK